MAMIIHANPRIMIIEALIISPFAFPEKFRGIETPSQVLCGGFPEKGRVNTLTHIFLIIPLKARRHKSGNSFCCLSRYLRGRKGSRVEGVLLSAVVIPKGFVPCFITKKREGLSVLSFHLLIGQNH
jgi:hypothetical protein